MLTAIRLHSKVAVCEICWCYSQAEDKQAPIILLRFQAQQINCIRNREGEVVDGAEDEVLAYYYIFAFQRDYDDAQEALRWRIVDIHMQRGGRYY